MKNAKYEKSFLKCRPFVQKLKCDRLYWYTRERNLVKENYFLEKFPHLRAHGPPSKDKALGVSLQDTQSTLWKDRHILEEKQNSK